MEFAIRTYFHIWLSIIAGLSTSFAWNSNIRRYESYDLEKGPVFYEAYYLDNNDKGFQEKRYFDRGAVLERTFQVPLNHFESPYREEQFSTSRQDSYRELPKSLRQYPDEYSSNLRRIVNVNDYDPRSTFPANYAPQNDRYDRKFFVPTNNGDFPLERSNENLPSLPRREIEPGESSNLAKRALPLEYEKWRLSNAYYEPVTNYYRNGKMSRLDSPNQENIFENNRASINRNIFEETPRSFQLEIPTSFDPQTRVSLENSQVKYRRERVDDLERPESHSSRSPEDPREMQELSPIDTALPLENIFEPRPQVIRYIFSKTPRKVESHTETEIKETHESQPRSYGDNLIQDELKKEKKQDETEAKVTSIEVSEVPRHKTRHHHGEWPKRDYSHHRRSSASI